MTVVKITDDSLYKLGNEQGTIEELLSRNQFSVCRDKLILLKNVLPEKKSLRQLANE